MPDMDYYGGENTPDKTKPEGDSPEEGNERSALVPKSIFGEKMPEVGEECVFHVEHIWENEVEISYGEPDKKMQPKRTAMDDATDGFDSMAAPDETKE